MCRLSSILPLPIKLTKLFTLKTGFTVIEVMIAGALLAIGCLGVLAMLITVTSQNQVTQDRTDATYIAESIISRLETQAETQKQNQTSPPSTPTPADNTPLKQLQTAAGNTNWTIAFPYNRQGVFIQNAEHFNDKQFSVGFKLLPQNNAYDSQYVRGAIRVTWARRGAAPCPATFEVLDTDMNHNCDMVTLPFTIPIKGGANGLGSIH